MVGAARRRRTLRDGSAAFLIRASRSRATRLRPPRRIEIRRRLLAALARGFYFGAAELGCKCICHCRTGEIPA